MSRQGKMVFRWFLLDDYEQEEAWLAQMHRSGWKLDRIRWHIYWFKPCRPEEWEYRMDFGERWTGEDYLSEYKDYGWEYIQDLNSFSYFRRPKWRTGKSAKFGFEPEIFTDDVQRLKTAEKVMRWRLVPLLILLLLSIAVLIREGASGALSGLAGLVFVLIWVVIIIWGSIEYLRCRIGFARLKKKYETQG